MIEGLWVSLQLNEGWKLHICSVYIPPYAALNNILLFMTDLYEVIDKHKNDIFIVIEDFNLSNIDRQPDVSERNFLSVGANDPVSEYFIDNFELMDFKQFSNIRNANNTILDLVFSPSLAMTVNTCLSPSVNEDIHHPSLESLTSPNSMQRNTVQ
ncbi:hypothetical protein JTB14_031164 [Gonioctena quinquepunctata]|nr:hypothetical protein JTB14_031164 [Gonioctena quinquepunctata]